MDYLPQTLIILEDEMNIYREGKIKTIKTGVTESDLRASGYFDRHPDAIICNAKPSDATLEKWMDAGYARSIDGCKVEPDGTCPHNLPSWLIVLHCI